MAGVGERSQQWVEESSVNCYSLDVECPLKAQVLKLVLRVALLGGGGTFRRQAEWGSLGHWGSILGGECRTLALSSSHCLLLGF
jgi:hypothetical protein